MGLTQFTFIIRRTWRVWIAWNSRDFVLNRTGQIRHNRVSKRKRRSLSWMISRRQWCSQNIRSRVLEFDLVFGWVRWNLTSRSWWWESDVDDLSSSAGRAWLRRCRDGVEDVSSRLRECERCRECVLEDLDEILNTLSRVFAKVHRLMFTCYEIEMKGVMSGNENGCVFHPHVLDCDREIG